MLIDYTALRNIKTGHTVDTDYAITVDVEPYSPKNYWKGVVSESLNGSRVSVTHDDGIEYNIKTTLIENNGGVPDRADFREFLNSVKRGETFSIDGVSCILAKLNNGFTEQYQAATLTTFSFSVRVL